MRKWLFAPVVLLGLLAPALAQEPDLATAPRIPMAEFKSLYIAGQVLVVDVRDPASFAAGHIPGARSIPLGELLTPPRVSELRASTKPIVLYCA